MLMEGICLTWDTKKFYYLLEFFFLLPPAIVFPAPHFPIQLKNTQPLIKSIPLQQ